MKQAQIGLVLAGAALIGWMAPGLKTGSLSGNDGEARVLDAGSAAHARQGTSRNAAWLAGQTVLEREADGHFYADATVDGASYRLLVDTGASFVALTGRDASAMGLYWDDSELMPIGRGASGPVRGVPVTIERMEVGGFEAKDVQAAIIPDGLDISLLGQSFLSQISNVEISGDEMRLGG